MRDVGIPHNAIVLGHTAFCEWESSMESALSQEAAIAGAILGCAVGDAIGLPYEGLSKRRGVKLLGPPDRNRFVFGHGMVSDDTEHTCMLAQALCVAPHDPALLARAFAWRLRCWLLGIPAGIGFATLKATIKLWCGFSPKHSGVFSAGNGPAMRSAILGAAIDDLSHLTKFVRAATTITHTDPKAYHGALAVAVAAWCSKRSVDQLTFFATLGMAMDVDNPAVEFGQLMEKLAGSMEAGESTDQFAARLGCERGVSGYVYRTVPVALHAWMSHPRDVRQAIESVIRCGGDTDTTAAIVGSIIGAGVGRAGLPPDWVAGIWEWPRTVDWMQRLADATASAVATGEPVRPPRVIPFLGPLRNLIFLGVVLTHVFRRCLPPY